MPNIILETPMNTEPSASLFKPGGTITILNRDLSPRIAHQYADKLGLGCYSVITIKQDKNTGVNFITVYHVGKRTKYGITTANLQQ